MFLRLCQIVSRRHSIQKAGKGV
jgi:hypothetical protein